ncbi:MAG: hypothetical protein ACTHNA_14260 [Sphingopyxis terrae]|uniref:hypothetical protein n=1 Tax=Sphingopyxis terrae TaxID=33052 RepID=UPI003F7E06FF
MIAAIDDARLRRNRRERPWTPEHDATLQSMKAAGLTIAAISERLGRTPQAVSSRIYNLAADENPIRINRDFLSEKIELYMDTIFRLNQSKFANVQELKQRCYGWR